MATTIIDELLSRFSNRMLIQHKHTALFYSEDCLKHKASVFIEIPERCSNSFHLLKHYGLLKYLNVIEPREATIKELTGTHSNNHIQKITTHNCQNSSVNNSEYNKDSARAARLAAGATIDLLSGILQNEYDNGFALIRPPGHHCEHNKCMSLSGTIC